jgi:hypothetical protein
MHIKNRFIPSCRVGHFGARKKFVMTRALRSSCRAYEIFKHHCSSRVGIPNCETTQLNAYTRTEPVSFKYRFLYLHFVAKELLYQHAKTACQRSNPSL